MPEVSAQTPDEPAKRDPRDIWLNAARQFNFRVKGNPMVITRYDNHGGLIKDGKWVAMFPLGALNPWYAHYNRETEEWEAEYKFGNGFDTKEQAYTAGARAVETMIARGTWVANPARRSR